MQKSSWPSARPTGAAAIAQHVERCELAERLEVSGRTVRNDIERLRQLDYPVEAVVVLAGITGSGSAPSCRRCCSTTTRQLRWQSVSAR